jgi:ubiquinone/menaquinone biosynthesis C-methylase UbiE/rRNA maturation protein Nop10
MTVPSTPLRYTFKPVTQCEMCGDSTAQHKVLGLRLNKSQGLSPRSKTGIAASIKRCSNCGLVYSTPQPIPSSIQDHYGVPPESYWDSAYFDIEESYFVPQIEKAKSLINFKPGMKSLDVGSGIGKGIVAMAKAGFDSYGLEPSETFYKKSQEYTKVGEDKLQLSSIEDAQYDDNTFDFISMKAVVEHMYTPSASLAKAAKWIKPGGVIYVEVPSADYFVTGFIDLYFKLIGTNYTSHISPMHEPYHLFEFTQRSFEENGKINNYTITGIDYDVCEIMFFPRLLHPLLRKYMELTKKGMDIQVWLKKK